MEIESGNTLALNTLERFHRDKRLRIVYNNKTKGFVAALNYGILLSRGVYIARMDGDDISLPNRLKRQVENITRLRLDIIGGWAYIVNETGSIIGELTPPTSAEDIRKSILLHNPFLHSAILFKKSILKKSGVYNNALSGAEDYDLWIRIISLGYKYGNLPSYVVMLRETSNSLMRGKLWRKTRVNYA